MAKMLAKANPGWPGEVGDCGHRQCRCALYWRWGELTPGAKRARKRSQRARERAAVRREASRVQADRD